MRFVNLGAVNLFWLLAGLVVFYIWAVAESGRTKEKFAQKSLMTDLEKNFEPKKRRLKAYFILAAMFLSILAMMRPQWGFQWQEVHRSGLDILIAIDTSKSMLAEDVKPNRLERAKLAVKDLIRKLKGDRVGLIAFAGKAFLQCPLTVDYGGFMLTLDDLNVDTIPLPGTSISSAIYEALRSYEGGINDYKILVLITDGEDHEGDPIAAAKEAKAKGIRIFCVG
ncbi:MAG: VWA domain-containing protein, partial [Candidatus Omnitrophota bacterium]